MVRLVNRTYILDAPYCSQKVGGNTRKATNHVGDVDWSKRQFIRGVDHLSEAPSDKLKQVEPVAREEAESFVDWFRTHFVHAEMRYEMRPMYMP